MVIDAITGGGKGFNDRLPGYNDRDESLKNPIYFGGIVQREFWAKR